MLDSVMCFQRFIVLEHLVAYFTRNLCSSHMDTFYMCFDMSSDFETFPTQLTTKNLHPSFIVCRRNIGIIIKSTTWRINMLKALKHGLKDQYSSIKLFITIIYYLVEKILWTTLMCVFKDCTFLKFFPHKEQLDATGLMDSPWTWAICLAQLSFLPKFFPQILHWAEPSSNTRVSVCCIPRTLN